MTDREFFARDADLIKDRERIERSAQRAGEHAVYSEGLATAQWHLDHIMALRVELIANKAQREALFKEFINLHADAVA